MAQCRRSGTATTKGAGAGQRERLRRARGAPRRWWRAPCAADWTASHSAAQSTPWRGPSTPTRWWTVRRARCRAMGTARSGSRAAPGTEPSSLPPFPGPLSTRREAVVELRGQLERWRGEGMRVLVGSGLRVRLPGQIRGSPGPGSLGTGLEDGARALRGACVGRRRERTQPRRLRRRAQPQDRDSRGRSGGASRAARRPRSRANESTSSPSCTTARAPDGRRGP